MDVRVGSEARVTRLTVSTYTVPTDRPEADATLDWNHVVIVVAEVTAGGTTGIGYSYADRGAAAVIQHRLAPVVEGSDAMAIAGTWRAMVRAVRDAGRPGIAARAISAVDTALWDLKARLLGVPLAILLGPVYDGVPVYGSGGFTSYSIKEVQDQLADWVEQGLRAVKMKIGAQPAEDFARVAAAREAIGGEIQLFVDASGAYSRKQALAFAEAFRELGVRWFEEPVPADDLEGLRLLRDRAPADMDIAAGEHGDDLVYFRRMLQAGAVDVLQVDATRCGGITGFLRAGAVCDAHLIPLSAHAAPSLHVAPCCATAGVRHLEYFHDHVRVEQLLFDGAATPVGGRLYPDLSRPGLGLELKRADAERFAV